MKGRPEPNEAAAYYSSYIDRVAGDDVLSFLETQVGETQEMLAGISEERSLHRYAPGKWSIREVVNHVNDTERAFQFRALWFARGFEAALPGYDQNVGVAGAQADAVPLAAHLDEFRDVRAATLSLFRHLRADAWMRAGIANENRFTVRAVAYIIGGHVAHHMAILRERYL